VYLKLQKYSEFLDRSNTAARKDESAGSRQVFVLFCLFLYRGYLLTLFYFIPRKGRGEEGPQGLSEDTDGVVG
jgi:hypothetical protein